MEVVDEAIERDGLGSLRLLDLDTVRERWDVPMKSRRNEQSNIRNSVGTNNCNTDDMGAARSVIGFGVFGRNR